MILCTNTHSYTPRPQRLRRRLKIYKCKRIRRVTIARSLPTLGRRGGERPVERADRARAAGRGTKSSKIGENDSFFTTCVCVCLSFLRVNSVRLVHLACSYPATIEDVAGSKIRFKMIIFGDFLRENRQPDMTSDFFSTLWM